MDKESQKLAAKRELTYRVGWKKGTMQVGENGQVTGSASALVFMERKKYERLLDGWIWREAPCLPVRALVVVLYVLPVALFGLVWWLVYMLSAL
ncbi:hypothetical protein ACFFNY_15645 [Paenibacillus hodogayensis]|uniref:Uncharacterized protein n=1 Tax=Paenibacillus hodogayensis TaxID=279208 RepID=A0ABV5VXM2_9BACL